MDKSRMIKKLLDKQKKIKTQLNTHVPEDLLTLRSKLEDIRRKYDKDVQK